PKAITHCSKQETKYSFVGALFVVFFLYGVLAKFTHSNIPFLDALVSGVAWVGAYLLVQRKIENWLWLTASNMLAIPLQLYKAMPLTATLTIIYLILGIGGFLDWKKTANPHTINASQ
ncbi:MAG: nicotinamide mononucleotide transporter, partial [Chitinophagaceae bacterium]|nr:nicotinamide mononucleotide transporter [Chitinophagaceae bacterium]